MFALWRDEVFNQLGCFMCEFSPLWIFNASAALALIDGIRTRGLSAMSATSQIELPEFTFSFAELWDRALALLRYRARQLHRLSMRL